MFDLRRNRLDYTGELLVPPPGYHFERAVATTYSLDLETLLAVLLPLAFGSIDDAPGLSCDGPLLLRALNRVAARLTVFHQAGQIPVPDRNTPLYALLDRILVPVALPRVHGTYPSFHPKTWTIEYRDREGGVLYRFVALSRNLTFDRSLDVAISLESGDDRRRTRATKPLCGFLTYLARRVGKELPHAREHVRRVEAISSGLLSNPLVLDGDGPWEDFEIMPVFGDGTAPDDPLFTDGESPGDELPDRLVAVSPFLSENVVERMSQRVCGGYERDFTLLTRPEAWGSLPAMARKGIEAWALKDEIAAPDPPPGDDGANTDAEAPHTADLHAKLYLRQCPGETTLLLGSMNATDSGLHRNIEMMVRLHGNPRSYSCETLRRELFGPDPGKASNPFERLSPNEAEAATDTGEEAARHLAQDAVQSFCRCGARGRAERDGDFWTLAVDIPATFAPPADVECLLRPLALKTECARPAHGTLHFPGLREAYISPLFVFTVETGVCKIARVVRVPMDGIDEAMRDKAVAQTVIEADGGWANAVALLFADEPYYTVAELRRRLAESGAHASGVLPTSGLYEKMLLAATSPEARERFAEAESILDGQNGPEARQVKDLLDVFRMALGNGNATRRRP